MNFNFALMRSTAMAAGCSAETFRDEARKVLTPAGFSKFEASMLVAAQQHVAALQAAAPKVQKLVAVMHPDATEGAIFASAVLQFLNQRAQPDWLGNELGHIV